MTTTDDEKAAEAWMGDKPFDLERSCMKGAFLAGLQHERGKMREKLREAFEAGKAMSDGWVSVGGGNSDKYKTFEDWEGR